MPAAPDMFAKVMALAKRRGFLWPSYELYGGVAGFYDYGPMGARLKASLEALWRRYYVAGEGFAELSAPVIAPEAVFKASGHLEKFTDIMVECTKCGEVFRADHLLLELFPDESPPSTLEDMALMLKQRDVKCPKDRGALSEPYPFNLMFRTFIGPGIKRTGYLRPETAQAMFMDFGLLYRHFREKLPFGAVQIGRGYRNEIAPRQGIIRLREFNMAEAEIFVDPAKKMVHARFAALGDDVLTLLPAGGSASPMTLKDAVARKTIASQSVAYYMAITQRILVAAGVNPGKLRFRQHERDEMAHYAADCWDAEVELSFGWTEAVGIADRTCYDLEAHMKASGADLRAYVKFDEPKTVERTVVSLVHNVLGPRYKKDSKDIAKAMESLEACTLEGKDFAEVDVGGKKVRVDKDCYAIKKVTETVNGLWFTPHVIEPSYGIDRIIYAILEHSFSEGTKEGEPYTVLRLRPAMAPVQVGVFPLTGRDELVVVAEDIDRHLREAGIATYLDSSDSIGRRYARMDEVGTPFCITVDFDGLKDGTVTIRDRDSTKQIRVPSEGIAGIFGELIAGRRGID